jgi:hypothetical protein
MIRLFPLAVLVACGGPSDPEVSGVLEGDAWFSRASLDLLGRRPTVEELEKAQENPDETEAMVLGLLDSDLLPERMGWVWNDTVHTAIWATQVFRFEQFDEGWSADQARAVGLEVPAVLSLLLKEDRPLTELVTANGIPVHADLPPLWPSSGTGDWVFGQYGDGRPHAGVLSSSAFWMRYNADATNYNRLRANAVARTFLCSDYFDRGDRFEFAFDGQIGTVEDAVKTDPNCTTCHASLDPLGSFFGGFAERSINFSSERFLSYSALNADWYQFQTAAAYFGFSGSRLEDLGAMIAADPRFESCMVETFWRGIVGGDLQPDLESDAMILDELKTAFSDGGLRLRPLLTAIVTSDAYRNPEPRLMNTVQLAGTLSELLGPLADDDSQESLEALIWSPEKRIMGGNTDDVTVLNRDPNPSVSRVLLQEWVGKGVAEAAIAEDLDRPLAERRLVLADLPMETTDARKIFVYWVTSLTGQSLNVEDPLIDRLLGLYERVGGDSSDEGDQEQALQVSLRALIQHPMTAVY